jgi:hypothetical protein
MSGERKLLLQLLLVEKNPTRQRLYFELLKRISVGVGNTAPVFAIPDSESDSDSHSSCSYQSSHTSRVELPPSVAAPGYLKNGDRGIYFYQDTSKPPLDVFATFEEAAAALNDGAKASEIECACVTNTLYKGFRFVDKRHDATIPVPPSRKQRNGPPLKGLVAQLNPKGTHIIKVYSSQKAAIESMKQAGEPISTLSNALRKGKVCNNSLWKMYSDCDKSIQDTFQDELPEERLPGKRRLAPVVTAPHVTTAPDVTKAPDATAPDATTAPDVTTAPDATAPDATAPDVTTAPNATAPDATAPLVEAITT